MPYSFSHVKRISQLSVKQFSIKQFSKRTLSIVLIRCLVVALGEGHESSYVPTQSDS